MEYVKGWIKPFTEDQKIFFLLSLAEDLKRKREKLTQIDVISSGGVVDYCMVRFIKSLQLEVVRMEKELLTNSHEQTHCLKTDDNDNRGGEKNT